MANHWLIILFLTYCSILARYGVASDRRGWTVLAWFAYANFALNWLILDRIESDWIPVIAAIVEFLTIHTLIAVAWNGFAKRQSLLLGLFWLCHLALYVDVNSGSNLVYDHYETYILALLMCQMTLGANGIYRIIRKTGQGLRSSRPVWVHGFKLDSSSLQMHKKRDESETRRF